VAAAGRQAHGKTRDGARVPLAIGFPARQFPCPGFRPPRSNVAGARTIAGSREDGNRATESGGNRQKSRSPDRASSMRLARPAAIHHSPPERIGEFGSE
jgi:hypothetical protein